jgi:hypothetical protein
MIYISGPIVIIVAWTAWAEFLFWQVWKTLENTSKIQMLWNLGRQSACAVAHRQEDNDPQGKFRTIVSKKDFYIGVYYFYEK